MGSTGTHWQTSVFLFKLNLICQPLFNLVVWDILPGGEVKSIGRPGQKSAK